MRFIYSRWFVIFFCSLVGVVILLFLQTRGLTEPVQRLILYAPKPLISSITFLAAPVRQFGSTITHLGRLSKQNIALEARLRSLEDQVVETNQLRRDNEVLRQELKFIQSTDAELVPCSVLSRDPEGLADTLVLSCNKKDGIAEGMAVIAAGRLAAKLVYVGQFSSTARLIIHDDSTVDARLSNNGGLGILRGSFRSGLILEQLSQNIEVKKGDLVVTAGINALIPKNIMIGEIGEIVSTPNDSFKRATIISPLEFKSLDYVFVEKP